MEAGKRNRRLARAKLAGGVLALVIAIWIVARLDPALLDAGALAERLRNAGAAGAAVLYALLVLQCVVAPLPSEPLMMAAGFVYGARGGFLLGWAGVVTGACACFVIARTLGRPVVERFVGANRLGEFDHFVAERGFPATLAALLALRLFAFTSFDVLSYACGLVCFPFRWFLAATAVGGVPKVLAFTYLGANVGERPAWLDWMIAAGTLGALVLASWLWRRLRRREPSAAEA